MSKSPKNNNLDKYRERQGAINEALVKRAIDYIKELKGEINFSSVSKVTYDIADVQKGEEGITLAGISKSIVYRPMVEKAKAASSLGVSEESSSIKSLSVGDMQMSFHSLRVQNAKLKMENKVLSQSLKETEAPKQEIGNIQEDVIKQWEEMKQVSSSLVSRLMELELAYIDTKNATLNVTVYDEVIVSSKALKLFYEKELNELEY